MSSKPGGAKGRNNAFDKFVCNVFSKIARTVTEARVLVPGVKENKDKDENFLIHTRVVTEVDEDLPDLVRTRDGTPTSLLVLTISVDTHAEFSLPGAGVSCRMQPGVVPSSGLGQQPSPRGEGRWEADTNRYRVLERWIMQRQVHEADTCNVVNPSAVVKQLLLLVRAVYSCLRLLPGHKTAVQLQSCSASMGLKYRLSNSLATPSNETCFGTHMHPVHEYSFGEVDTPSGRICVKVQYLVSNPEDYEVYAMDFPTQGLQRRDGRSLSLPTEVPDLQALLAPDSPYSGGPSQARHWSPQAFPLQHSMHMGMSPGATGWAASGVPGGTTGGGRPPRAPSSSRHPRRSLDGGEYAGSPHQSASPSPGAGPIGSPLPCSSDNSKFQRSPKRESPHHHVLAPLSLPAQAAPCASPDAMGAMAEAHARGGQNVGHGGHLGGGLGAIAGTVGAGGAGGASGVKGRSDCMAVPGAVPHGSTAFIDYVYQQQRTYSPAHPQHYGRTGSSPGGGSPYVGEGMSHMSPYVGEGMYPASSPAAGPGFAGFVPGTSPGAVECGVGGVVGGFSPSSPSHVSSLLMQSFNSPFNEVSPLNDLRRDVPWGSPDHPSGETMQLVVTASKSKRRPQQQQQVGADAAAIGSVGIEDDEYNAPFALEDVDEGGPDSMGLETLTRLLEQNVPSYLSEDDALARGVNAGGCGDAVCGSVLDSDLDTLLCMPAASDLSVGDLIWDMQQMQQVIETQIQPMLNATSSKT